MLQLCTRIHKCINYSSNASDIYFPSECDIVPKTGPGKNPTITINIILSKKKKKKEKQNSNAKLCNRTSAKFTRDNIWDLCLFNSSQTHSPQKMFLKYYGVHYQGLNLLAYTNTCFEICCQVAWEKHTVTDKQEI